MLPVKAYGATG